MRQASVGVRLALAEEPRLDDGPLLVALATHHVARVLRTASTQQALDAATYAFQVCPSTLPIPKPKTRK